MPIDYSTYHPKWKLISRFIRFFRARNRCEWCNAENYQPHPITGSKVILTVAHIDHDKTNNSFFNLAALCQRCHLNHDRPHHIAKRKANKLKPVGFIDLMAEGIYTGPLTCTHEITSHNLMDKLQPFIDHEEAKHNVKPR